MPKKQKLTAYLRAATKEQVNLGYLLRAECKAHLLETMKRVWQKRKAQAALKQGGSTNAN